MRTITSLEMRAIDRNAHYLGMNPSALMENAGRQAAYEVMKRREPSTAAILCGPGNNGGDGFVVARHLRNAGWEPTIVLTHAPSSGESRGNLKVLGEMGIPIQHITDSSQAMDTGFIEWLCGQGLIVDALLGTGARGAPREPIASIVDAAMKSEAYRVSIDVPSGMDADTGEYGQTVFKASLTVTFHLAKTGHAAGGEKVGELVVSDIGIPAEAETHTGPGDLLFVNDQRAVSSHKGENGVLLVVGGSREYHGAPALCGISAMRTGIDLVYLVVPESIREIEAKHSPSLIVKSYQGDSLSLENLPLIAELEKKVDAICIGPGLGAEPDTLETVSRLVRSTAKPMVIDADGLKSFRGKTEDLARNTVITPHAREFMTLTDERLPDDESGRVETVSKWAAKTECVWTVKGESDIIAQGDHFKLNRTGTACMTVGGTGDCLAGAIGAFLARGHDPFRSAAAAAFVLGVAGEIATREKGCHLLPTDVIERIPEAFKTFDRDR